MAEVHFYYYYFYTVRDNIFHLWKFGDSDKTKSNFKQVLTESFLMELGYPVHFS